MITPLNGKESCGKREGEEEREREGVSFRLCVRRNAKCTRESGRGLSRGFPTFSLFFLHAASILLDDSFNFLVRAHLALPSIRHPFIFCSVFYAELAGPAFFSGSSGNE